MRDVIRCTMMRVTRKMTAPTPICVIWMLGIDICSVIRCAVSRWKMMKNAAAAPAATHETIDSTSRLKPRYMASRPEMSASASTAASR